MLWSRNQDANEERFVADGVNGYRKAMLNGSQRVVLPIPKAVGTGGIRIPAGMLSRAFATHDLTPKGLEAIRAKENRPPAG